MKAVTKGDLLQRTSGDYALMHYNSGEFLWNTSSNYMFKYICSNLHLQFHNHNKMQSRHLQLMQIRM